jgi:hypothetical protein
MGVVLPPFSPEKEVGMLILLLALLVILIIAGAGFALHVLWWVAIAALIVWLLGVLFRR